MCTLPPQYEEKLAIVNGYKSAPTSLSTIIMDGHHHIQIFSNTDFIYKAVFKNARIWEDVEVDSKTMLTHAEFRGFIGYFFFENGVGAATRERHSRKR